MGLALYNIHYDLYNGVEPNKTQLPPNFSSELGRERPMPYASGFLNRMYENFLGQQLVYVIYVIRCDIW